MDNPFAHLTPSQTWEQHLRNAGPTLGGVDYALAVGTLLPLVPGDPFWVTPATPLRHRPLWYNTGLGNVGYYRRADGTVTAFGHCSEQRDDERFLSGNTGRSTGPHVHVMDILADGITRARPFTTYSIEPPRRHTMTTMFVKASTTAGNLNAGKGSLWALAGDAGAPCPGNWIEFTRDPADGSVHDRGRRMAAVHGNAILLTDAEWEAYKRAYTTPAPLTAVPVDVAAQADAVADELRDRLQE